MLKFFNGMDLAVWRNLSSEKKNTIWINFNCLFSVIIQGSPFKFKVLKQQLEGSLTILVASLFSQAIITFLMKVNFSIFSTLPTQGSVYLK
jgi:hypothetical protein